MREDYPKVSFVICTLNCRDYTERCIKSIRKQDYPQKKIEIIVVDSYSDDGTIEIAKKLGAKVILTKIRGYMEGKGMPKSIGCEKAKGDIIITIDSDNALVEKDWIKKMVYPLVNNPEVSFSICRMAVVRTDPLSNQYLSYVGTDPFAIYGSLDPQITLGKIKLEDKGRYWTYKLTPHNFYVVGGYYVAFKRETLKKIGGYMRDVDNAYTLAKMGLGTLAIPKNCHLHHLITDNGWKFIKKKIKWGAYYFKAGKEERVFKWYNGWTGRFGKINFGYQVIKDLLIIPEFITSVRMFIKYKNRAWLLHSPMMFGATVAYIIAFLKIRLNRKNK